MLREREQLIAHVSTKMEGHHDAVIVTDDVGGRRVEQASGEVKKSDTHVERMVGEEGREVERRKTHVQTVHSERNIRVCAQA